MSWPEQLHETPLMAAPEDEFSNFLEFNMPFPDIEGHGPANMQHSQQHSLPTTTAPESEMGYSQAHAVQYPGKMDGMAMDFSHDPTQSHQHPVNQMAYSAPGMTPGFCAQEPSPMSQPPTHQHYMQGQTMIPPTPNSIEMHGNAARYSQRVDGTPELYDRYGRINEEQVSQRLPHGGFPSNRLGSLYPSRITSYDPPGKPISTP